MIINEDSNEVRGEYVPPKGIGLYKVNYEIDIQGSDKENQYTAGVMAYSSDESVSSIVDFCKQTIKKFKGIRVHQVSYEGPIHTMSKAVKQAVLKTSILEGHVVSKEDFDAAVKAGKKKTAKKTSIIPKTKTEE